MEQGACQSEICRRPALSGVFIHQSCGNSDRYEAVVGVLIEHYAGAFPLWLSPVQVRVLTIAERHSGYAQKLIERLRKEGFRVEPDLRTEKIGYKIREAEMMRVPYIFVVGDKEMESGQVAVRMRGRQDLGAQDIGAMIERLRQEIGQRK